MPHGPHAQEKNHVIQWRLSIVIVAAATLVAGLHACSKENVIDNRSVLPQ